MAYTAPGVVTATSSQYIARNHNGVVAPVAFAAPVAQKIVAAPAQVAYAAPAPIPEKLIASAPVAYTAQKLVAPAQVAYAAPAIAAVPEKLVASAPVTYSSAPLTYSPYSSPLSAPLTYSPYSSPLLHSHYASPFTYSQQYVF